MTGTGRVVARRSRLAVQLALVAVLVPSQVVALGTAFRQTSTAVAELILYNADVITVDAAFTRAEAVAIAGGRIIAVGADADVLALAAASTAVVDLGGRALLPGFVDPHVHSVQNQTPDLLAMLGEQRTLIEGGTTTVGTPAISPLNMVGYDEFVERQLLLQRTHLYVGYNDNCGVVDTDGFWTSVPFDRSPDELLVFAGVKVFADGGSCHGPAVSFDYLPTMPGYLRDVGWAGSGSLFTAADEIATVVAATDARGGMVVIHAIGDVAIGAALDGIDDGLAGAPNANGHRIDHNSFSSLLADDELARYGQLGITPAVQLMPWANACAPDTLANWQLTIPAGPYAVVEHLDALKAANPELLIAWHGDGPYVPGTPLQHMYSPVTRDAVDGVTGDVCDPPGWDNTPTISVAEAIRMTTINAATAMQLDDAIGSIEIGKYADLIVLAADPFGPDPIVALAQNRPVATLIGGSLMYCDAVAVACDAFATMPPLAMIDPAAALDLPPSTSMAPPPPSPSASAPAGAWTPVDDGIVVAARASNEHAPVAAAFDGDIDAGWVSGQDAPQWIEFDLGTPTAVAALQLRVDQAPDGPTTHQITGGDEPAPTDVIATLDGETAWGDWLTVAIDATVRYVRIETISSPSWVAWLEIDVITA